MRFTYSTHVLCSCGKGQECRKLWRADKSWNSRHGSAGYACRIPTSAGVKPVKRYGYPSKAAAEAAAQQAGKLLELAGADDATRCKIGDMIVAVKRGGQLPAVEDVRRRLGLGQDPDAPGITFAEWFETWITGKRRLRASVVRSYRSHAANWLIPNLGDVRLERMNAGHVGGLFATIERINAEVTRQRAEGRAYVSVDGDARSMLGRSVPRVVSAATQQRIFATLRACLNGAVKARLLMYNPCGGYEPLPETPPEGARWSPAEAARFIAATAGDPLGLLFRIMILRGLRRSEAIGLRWAGADLEQGTLTVARTILELGGKLHEEPTAKTRAGDRVVFLDAATAELLRAYRKAQLAARLGAGQAWQDNDLIFCQANGRPWIPGYVSKRFKALASAVGVPVIKLHEGGRHTAVSMMRDAGVDPVIRMREVGHSSETVHDRYTHTMAQAHMEAAEAVAALVRKAGGAP